MHSVTNVFSTISSSHFFYGYYDSCYERGILIMVNNGILIKIFMEINEDNLSDVECLLSFIDDFPCWSQEPKTEIFIPRKEPNAPLRAPQ